MPRHERLEQNLNMTTYTNQHYVPQYYFKMFTKGRPRIHILLTTQDRIAINASIRGQCARTRFYGPKNIERIFSQLEGNHRTALRRIVDVAWASSRPLLEAKHLGWLWEAIVFQRARTELEISKTSPAIEALCLEVLKGHTEHAPDIADRAKLVEAIERGDVSFTEPGQATVFRSIATAMESVLLISDLDLHILRNHTDYPFIFSDSPVVFCNTYYENIKHRGVIGLQTPGLQIFYPLDSRTMLMLNDDEVYGGKRLESVVIDIVERSDISQLNALQLHHSLNTVYFARAKDEEYVTRLWRAHKHRIVQPRMNFEMREDWLVDGKPPVGVLYHMFESQLNIGLKVSFFDCEPIAPAEYQFRRRSPELVEEVRSRRGGTQGTPNSKDGR